MIFVLTSVMLPVMLPASCCRCRYQKWRCLMGTSIQSKPGQGAKVEANAGQG